MIPQQMAQTLERETERISVEELQRLVDGAQTCNIADQVNELLQKLPSFVRVLFRELPHCHEPAVAQYEMSCVSHGAAAYWVCEFHEQEIVKEGPRTCWDGHPITIRRVS